MATMGFKGQTIKINTHTNIIIRS